MIKTEWWVRFGEDKIKSHIARHPTPPKLSDKRQRIKDLEDIGLTIA